MRKTQITAVCAGLAVTATIFSGCSGSGSAAEQGQPEVWALLPQGTDQPYGTTYLPPFQETADKLGLNVTTTNSQYDSDTQASDCEVAVAARPELIILWPAVTSTVRPCLVRAKEAGIPVTITNSDVLPEDKELTAGYSGPDTYGQGAASASIMCELADGQPINILVVNGLTGNYTAINRRQGFVETIARDCPNVTIAAEQPGDWSKGTAQTVTSEMLTAVGAQNVQGIFAADDTMVAGAIDALKAQGIDPKPLFITSIGNTKLGNPLVKSGELDGTVFQSSVWDGRNAAVVADEVLKNGPMTEDLFMPSVIVTEENVDSPDVTPEW